MKTRADTRTLMLGVAFLLFLSLFVTPRSASSQSSFSLALDLDISEGDQAVTLLEVVPGKVVSIQIFGVDMQNANGISLYFGYDAAEVVYLGFEAAGIIPNALMFFEQDSTSVRINASSLSGSATANAGLVGTVRFRTTAGFSDTEIWLARANLTRGGRSETVSPDLGVALQAPALPSPDFNGSGVVDFADFVLFAGVFGYREGDEAFDARYDLNIDNGIGFEDFVIFARSFGEAVNRAPVFAAAAPVTRSLAENASGEQLIGDPISATDADGDALNYRLRGRHAASFAIDASTGQLRAKEGITYDHEAKDSYYITVRASDGKGGRASLGVNIAVTDVDEPPVAPPQQYVVVYGDGGVTIRWNASTDEAGKPPVSGYELQRREVDSDEWEAVQILESPSDTSLTLTDLTRDETYLVRVRTLNEEGSSEWSAPVDVTAPTVFINVCNRTEQVRDAIVAAAGASACGEVLAQRLAAITELWVISRGITSLKANDFSGLTALKSLNLANNAIGSIPAGIFTDLAALEFLNMPHSITNLPANVFYSLSALKHLGFSSNNFGNPHASLFFSLSHLEKLYISGNKFTSLPANVFSNLRALKLLNLRSNDISSLDASLFFKLSNLENLLLLGNEITSLDANVFSSLSKLKKLELRDNKIRSLDADVFSNLAALEELLLYNNEIGSLDVSIFSNLTALTELSLGKNKLTSLPANLFSNLSALKTLELRGNGIINLDANIFSNLSALTSLHLDENKIANVPADLFSNLTALESLGLFDNGITSLDANLFSNLTALKALDLRFNDISNLQATIFTNLSALESLNLFDNAINGLDEHLFSNQSALRRLSLGRNAIPFLPSNLFSGTEALEKLFLENNRLNSLPESLFSGLSSLVLVRVSGNPTNPLPITVSLEVTETGRFKAKAHTGAPFEMALPLQVVNGSVSGGASRIVIPLGALESDVLTIARTAGTTAKVTIDIVSFPARPTSHNGYAFVRSSDLPLQVIAPSQ